MLIAKPVNLHRRGASLSAVEVTASSWSLQISFCSQQAACVDVTLLVNAVTDVMDTEPLELHRRGASLSTFEVAAGSWAVKGPGQHLAGPRTSDHGSRPGDLLGAGRRRNSLSMTSHDASAFRNAIRSSQKPAVSIQAVAGPGGSFWQVIKTMGCLSSKIMRGREYAM